MWAYIIRRLLLSIPTVLGVTIIVFLLFMTILFFLLFGLVPLVSAQLTQLVQ